MSNKKYKERRMPSLHKGDSASYEARRNDEWWSTKPLWNQPKKSWKRYRKTQYRPVEM